MPAISIISGKVDFSDMMFEVGSVSIKYGNFITEIVNFLIIAFSIFLAITYVNKLSKKMEAISLGQLDKLNKKIGKNKKAAVEEPAPEPTVKICPFCYSEINYKASRCPHCTSVLETEKN